MSHPISQLWNAVTSGETSLQSSPSLGPQELESPPMSNNAEPKQLDPSHRRTGRTNTAATALVKDTSKSKKDVPDYRGCLKVQVGKGSMSQTFDVHEALITARSEFFKRALSGNWKEAQDRIVKLPEDDPATFKYYVHLLYTGSLAILPISGLIGWVEITGLAKLYVLAEQLQYAETKNIVLEARLLSSRHKGRNSPAHVPWADEIKIIYSGTPPGCPLRKLLVDLLAHRAQPGMHMANHPHWLRDFLQDLALQLVSKRKVPAYDPTQTGDASNYLNIGAAAKP